MTETDRCGMASATAWQTLETTLTYADRRDYRGYDYADGSSSRLLRALPVENHWLSLGFQEVAKRFPVNIRPLLLVPKRRSFKGAALFTLANLHAYDSARQPQYLEAARTLVDWLLDNRSQDPFGWGHNHPIQTLHGTVERNTPSVVTTSYVTRAVLELANYVDTDGYALVRDDVPRLLVEDLDYTERDPGASINYRTSGNLSAAVLNANALGARALLDLYAEFGRRKWLDRAEALLDFVASRQTAGGGWTYTDPPGTSHLSKDNFHNGFILESLFRHAAVTGSNRYREVLDDGLRFYRQVLHEPDGAPNWDERRSYPRDIHAAAQSIVTFIAAGDRRSAARVLEWTLDHLYSGEGRFYYQQRRWYIKRFTLMRWCQAWMAYALGSFETGSVLPTGRLADRGTVLGDER